MQVKEIMTTRLDLVGPDATLAEVARKMRDDDVGAVPIAEGPELLGMITDRDIVVRSVAEGRDVNAARVRDSLSPDLIFCREDQSLEEASSQMAEWRIRRLPVLDANDRLVGMVSLGDLAREPSSQAGEALREISQPTQSPRA